MGRGHLRPGIIGTQLMQYGWLLVPPAQDHTQAVPAEASQEHISLHPQIVPLILCLQLFFKNALSLGETPKWIST